MRTMEDNSRKGLNVEYVGIDCISPCHRILGLIYLLLEVPWCMLNMSLHASRDRELSPSQGGLLHPGVLGSVRKFSFMVILALSSAPAGSPAPPSGSARPEGQLRSPGRGCQDEVVGV